jgi:hypothetical protein
MIIHTIAERSLVVPPEARPAHIQDEVAKVREAFRQTYATDPRLTAYAMGFVDRIEGWTQAIASNAHPGACASAGDQWRQGGTKPLNRERAIMNDWYPVRLAPRDGTPVILWVEDVEAPPTYPVTVGV